MTNPSHASGLVTLDWIVIGVYLAIVLAQGWYYSRRQTSEGEFLVARAKPMGSFVIGLSMFATLMSTITYLSKPGEIINKGPMSAIAQIVAVPFGYAIVAYWILPRLMRQRVTSVYEYLEERIGVTGRVLGAALFIVLRLVWMGLMTYLTSSVLAIVMGLDPKWVPLLSIGVGAVTIAYSSMGGFRAVVMTDGLQAFLLFLGAITTVTVITWRLGDFSWIPTHWSPDWDTQPIFSLDPTVRVTLVGMVISMVLWRVATSASDQTSVQRFMAVKDLRAARRSFIVNSIAVIITSVLLSLVGLALLAYFTRVAGALPPHMTVEHNADQLFPYFIAHFLPPGLSGLIVTAFLAAAMSSLDSGVNAITAVVTRDFLDRFNKAPGTEAGKVRLMRWLTVGIGAAVVALGLVMKHIPGNVFAVTNKTASLVTAPIFALFLMAWYVPFITPLGALSGTFAGVVTAIVVGFWDVLTGNEAISFQYIGIASLIVSLAVGIPIAKIGPREERSMSTKIWAAGVAVTVSAAAVLLVVVGAGGVAE